MKNKTKVKSTVCWVHASCLEQCSIVVHFISQMIQPQALILDLFMMTIHFFKCYPTENQLAGLFQYCVKSNLHFEITLCKCISSIPHWQLSINHETHSIGLHYKIKAWPEEWDANNNMAHLFFLSQLMVHTATLISQKTSISPRIPSNILTPSSTTKLHSITSSMRLVCLFSKTSLHGLMAQSVLEAGIRALKC